MPRHALHLTGRVEQPANLVVALIELLQLRHGLQRSLNGEGVHGIHGDELGHAVHIGQRQLHHAADVPHGRARGQRAERRDLGHVIRPVGVGDVLDDFLAAVTREVEVHVGHGSLAADREEALEHDVVLDRVDIRHAHREGDQAAVHGTARGRQHPPLAGKANDVADEDEVGRKLGLLNHVKLVGQPRLIGGGDITGQPPT